MTSARRSRPVSPRLKVWVVFDERVKFGDGRAQLLDLIEQRGSLKHAVAETGMSYRAAWGYLRDLETAAGFKFLERTRGAGPRSGARLTREAKQFLERYRAFRRTVEATVTRGFTRSFPAP
jgi:molybdate transport system regulatory protein